METDTEAALLMKTRSDLVDAVVDRVRHCTATMCLASWRGILLGAMQTILADYLEWIEAETGENPGVEQ